MDAEAATSFSLQILQISFAFLFFFFTFSFLTFSIFMFFTRLDFWCNCEVCHTYFTSKWSSNFKNICDWYTNLLSNSCSGTFHIHVLGNTITTNPENVEYILKTNFGNYPKGKAFSSILGDLLGKGIFNVDGDLWRFQRKMASLELGSLHVRSFAFQIVSSEIENRLLPIMGSVADQNDAVLDLQDVFRRFAFDSICRFSFGLDPNCLNLSMSISEFAEAFDAASKLSASRAICISPLVWKVKRFFNLGSEEKLRKAIKIIDVLAYEMIREKRKLGFAIHQDMLSRFMESIQDEKYLRDIVVSFLLAGRDTVAAGLTSFFCLLSKHPHVVDSIRFELGRIMRKNDRVANFDQLREMHYLHAAIYESLRLYPPIQFDSKFAVNDDVLPDGTFIKRGTRVTYHAYAMGRMEKIWGPDCLEFKPERWLSNRVFTPGNPYKFPVFQAGLRVCLGKEMAIMEMKCVTVALVQRFDIKLVNSAWEPEFLPGLTATIKGGVSVCVRNR